MKCVGPDGPEPGDAELLRRVKRGDTEAFAPVVRRHLPSLRAFVALHLPVPHLADEVAHEAFVFAFRHLHELLIGVCFFDVAGVCLAGGGH